MKAYKRPYPFEVKSNDSFWTPYTEGIRDVMIPYCFDKFYETGYVGNFINVAEGSGIEHKGPPFTDGLLFETITGACNFLSAHYDKRIDEKISELEDIIISAQAPDGFICTNTMQKYPERRWGENGGDIIHQHDLYDQGALIEAAVAHYRATKSTKLLECAVKSANLICSYIGEAPKHNIIPGHSLPEMAFIMLYRLFKETDELSDFAEKNNVKPEEYLEIVRFWYDNRGVFDRGRTPSKVDAKFGPEYNQDTKPFAKQRVATGHAVRAGLCYAGAALASAELMREDYKTSLDAIFEDVVRKKMHISGGIGARHDIEGFDKEYDLPNGAYLETCAGIALAFWMAEMNLIDKDSKYFDVFELSLYNNILGAVGKDFKTYYYDNSLVNDGSKNRWSWHGCPCCPPMLAKIYSELFAYAVSFKKGELCINSYIGTEYENCDFKLLSEGKKIKLCVKDEKLTLSLRIPAYAESFALSVNGKKHEFSAEKGYAEINLPFGEYEISVSFTEPLREIYANPKVSEDIGKVCLMKGITLMCVEGVDNGGETDFTLPEKLSPIYDGENVIVKSADGKDVTFIPYFKRNNRVSDNVSNSKMQVWLKKEGALPKELFKKDSLYDSVIL